MRRYNYFQYSLPTHSAEMYAHQAIQLLQELRKDFPRFYEIFRAPSEVLTLSGVRAFDTYYTFGQDALEKDILAITDYMQKHGVWVIPETMAVAGESSRDNAFSLVNMKALHEIPKQYAYIPEWRDLIMDAVQRPEDFWCWWLYWKDMLGGELALGNLNLPKEWRNDWWAPHNITFGMLLGYPGEAICSLLHSDAGIAAGREIISESALSTPHIKKDAITIECQARIKHVDKFDGAWPQYSYHLQLKNNKNIRAHERLWSDILERTYKALGEL